MADICIVVVIIVSICALSSPDAKRAVPLLFIVTFWTPPPSATRCHKGLYINDVILFCILDNKNISRDSRDIKVDPQ